MGFKTFLLEFHRGISNEVDLIYQQILDNYADRHIDVKDKEITFNVGNLIHKSQYSDLNIVITKEEIEPFIDTEGDSITIHMHSKRLPNRKNIGNFLEKTEIASVIKKYIKKYLETHFDVENEHEPGTSHENKKHHAKNFEKGYHALIQAIDKKIEHVKNAQKYIDHNSKNNANHNKVHVSSMAMKELIKSELGDSFGKFKGIALKLPEAAFMQHLSGEQKNSMLSRLESYYEQKIHGFHKPKEDSEEE